MRQSQQRPEEDGQAPALQVIANVELDRMRVHQPSGKTIGAAISSRAAPVLFDKRAPAPWAHPSGHRRRGGSQGAPALHFLARAPQPMSVHYENDGPLAVVTIDRPEVANAIDAPTARELADAFRAFEADDSASVAVLTGSAGTFCAGADLKAMRSGDAERVTRLSPQGDGPVGGGAPRTRGGGARTRLHAAGGGQKRPPLLI